MSSQSPPVQEGSSPTGTSTIQADCMHDTLCGRLNNACVRIGCLSYADRHSVNFVAAELGNILPSARTCLQLVCTVSRVSWCTVQMLLAWPHVGIISLLLLTIERKGWCQVVSELTSSCICRIQVTRTSTTGSMEKIGECTTLQCC